MYVSNLKGLLFQLLPDKWIVRSGPRDNQVIYLTFDDGPHENYTNSLLVLLRQRNIKASFFVTGDHVKINSNLLQNIINDGHDVFNHSYSHWKFKKYSVANQIDDIGKLDKLLPEIRAHKLHPFRPPGGRLSIALFIQLIKTGRNVVHWSYNSMDYKKVSVEFLLKQFENKPVKAGDIILFHDDNPHTIDALPELIDKWIETGFKIEPVSKLL